MTNNLFLRAALVCLLALTFVSATRAQSSVIPTMCFDPTPLTATGTLVLNPPAASSVNVPVPYGRYRVRINPGGANEETVIGSSNLSQVVFTTANTHTAGETVLVYSDGSTVLGYNNPNSTTITVQTGFPENYFTPGTLRYPGQPTSFHPGVHENIFRLSVLNGDTLEWVLRSHTVSLRAPLNMDNICGTINYQGRLSQNGNLANGSYSMRFQAYDAETGGTAQGPMTSVANVTVTNGIFTVPLPLGSSVRNNFLFRFLEIGVRPASAPTTDPYTVLAPRQPITSVPYAINAIHARTAETALSATNATNATTAATATTATTATTAQSVSGVVSVANGGTGSTTQNFVDLTTNQTVGGNKSFTGTISGNGSGLTNLNTPTDGNYLYSFDTTTQAIATANTFQNVTFNSNGQIDAWIHNAGSSFFTTFTAGVYLVQYEVSAEVQSTVASSHTASARFTQNGVEINGSQSAISFTADIATTEGQKITKSLIVNAAANDIFTLQFAGSSTQVRMAPKGLGTIRPSASITIVRIR